MSFRSLKVCRRQFPLQLGQAVGDQDVRGRGVSHEPTDKPVRILGRIVHNDPTNQRVPATCVRVKAAGENSVDNLVRHESYIRMPQQNYENNR